MPHHCTSCKSNFRSLDDLLWHLDNGHSVSLPGPGAVERQNPEPFVHPSWHRWYSVPRHVRGRGNEYERRVDAIDKFFARYPRYSYKRDEPFWQQFRELCICYQWPTTRKDREADKDPNSSQKRAWKAFRIAVVQSFSTTFGTEVDDINAWRKLCMTVRVPGMRNLDGCRKVLL